MAVKFSDFTQKQDASVAVTNMVGYLAAGELNIMIPPANLDTTYVVSTKNAGASPTINIQGTKPGQTAVINPSTVSLTGSGGTLLAGDGSTTINFASTAYALTSTDTSPAGTVPLVLTGTGGGDAGTDTVSLVGTGTIGITSSGNTITINGTGGGGGGSVTNVSSASNASALTLVTTSPTSTPVVTLGVTGGSAGQFLNYLGNWATPAGGGGGGVTSIGMTVPAAFAVTPASITTSGTFAISGAGSASQVVLGNGTLGTLPTDTNTTYDLTSQASGTSVDVNLVPSTGTTDTIKLTPAGGLTITKSGDVITLDTSASGTGTVTNVTSADTNTITVASGASTPAITAVTSGGVGAGSTSLATGAQIQAAINSAVAGLLDYKGGYNASSNSPDLDSGSNIAISKGDAYTVTVAGTFFTEAVGIGDLLIANDDMAANGGSALTKWTTVQNNVGTAQVGATDAATAKGIAGFDNQMFATTANGFITSTTLNTVVITRVGAGNGLFYVDGTQQADITLMPDVTYLIDQSDASNDGHPLILSTTTPTKAEYATGVVYLLDNVPVANAAAYNTGFNAATTRQLRVTLNQVAPTLYYVCYNHQNMGGNISVSGSVTSVALTMPSAFAVGGSPITSSGTLAVTPTGGSSGQFLNYLGAWATPASAAPTKTVDQVTIANATTGTVSLTVSPTSEAYTDMYVSGVYQNKSVYSLSGSTITLDSSAYFPNGAIVEVVSTT
tara:strand:+ start:692 stop:2875 length:2184 start_codon:yes stop_codon:yes gene_type:complete